MSRDSGMIALAILLGVVVLGIMDRRRFLLTSRAGALAAPLAVEAQCPGRLLLPRVLPPRQ
jgi:hypothetical protein